MASSCTRPQRLLLDLLEEVYDNKPEGDYWKGWEARAKGVVGEYGCKVAKQLITFGFTLDKIASLFLWKVRHGLRLLKTFLGIEGDEELVRVLNAATPARASNFGWCWKCCRSLALVWWGADAVGHSVCYDCGPPQVEQAGLPVLSSVSGVGSAKDTEWLKRTVALDVRACPNTQHITSEDVHEMPYIMDNVGRAVRMADAEEGRAFNNQHHGNEYGVEERVEAEALACRKFQQSSYVKTCSRQEICRKPSVFCSISI